jgi:arginyl-tRNA synthetase
MQTFKDEVISLLEKEIKLPKQEISKLLETPPKQELGDLSFPCFTLSKEFKKAPNEISLSLQKKLKTNDKISKIESLGPYLNFFFNPEDLVKSTLDLVLSKNYLSPKKNKQKILMEFPSPNTNKPLHVGHLRNMALGESTSKLLESQGYEVIRVNLNNDRGIHICQSMLAYKNFGKNSQPDKKSDHFVGDYYVLFSKEAKKNPDLNQEAQELLKKWENNDSDTVKLWEQMNSWALEGFKETYKRFGISFNKQYYESKIYKKGAEMILSGLKQGKFKKDETDSIYIDLGKQLGKKVLLRSDGTSLYITQDLYLAKQKYDDYKFDKSIYVVANEQDYHFKVLFEILELLNYKFAKSCYHLSYGMVFLPSGRMKSREGNVIDADDLMDELSSLAKKEIQLRNDIQEKKLVDISEKIALSALKYFLLKFSQHKNFTFNPEESISFEGDTGPYIQYSLVRANKIQQKVKPLSSKISYSLLNSKEELSLIKKMSLFQSVLEKAASSYEPHILAEFAFSLATSFNTFYEKCHVIKAENKDIQNARLYLVSAYSKIIKHALYLLGINEVELM